jgi:hypothetical protein
MGQILAALTLDQRARLDGMVGEGMASWPVVQEVPELKGLGRDQKVAVMTYAGDMFSWYAGSVEADVYFCPERHGTYFGSFYLKDAPAVGNPGYSIDTTLTGNLGATLLSKLDSTQAALISGLVDAQRADLAKIVETRRTVSKDLRAFMAGGSADDTAVAALMKTYGELDGSLVFRYATAFAEVGRTLTEAQRTELGAIRSQLLGNLAIPSGAYLYSQPIAMPDIPSTDFLFGSAAPAPAEAAMPALRIAAGYRTSLSSAYGSAAFVANGAYVTLRATVSPALPGTSVRFYGRIGKTGPWTYLSGGRTDASGVLAWSRLVRVPATATGFGRYVYFRVAVPGSSAGSTIWSSIVRAVAK